jgi:antitoxin component YwqK of YwqJK toxin-antitoxin module
MTGPWKGWYPSGKIEKEGSFVDGKNDGAWTLYHENGQIKEKGVFKAGVREGVFESYSPTGALLSKGAFAAGKREGPWFYAKDDGSLDAQRSGVYVADVRTGDLPPDAARPGEEKK